MAAMLDSSEATCFRNSHTAVITVTGQAKELSADLRNSSKTVSPAVTHVITDHALPVSMLAPEV